MKAQLLFSTKKSLIRPIKNYAIKILWKQPCRLEIIMFELKRKVFISLHYGDQFTLISLNVRYLYFIRSKLYTTIVYTMLFPFTPSLGDRRRLYHIQKSCGGIKVQKILTYIFFLVNLIWYRMKLKL